MHSTKSRDSLHQYKSYQRQGHHQVINSTARSNKNDDLVVLIKEPPQVHFNTAQTMESPRYKAETTDSDEVDEIRVKYFSNKTNENADA